MLQRMSVPDPSLAPQQAASPQPASSQPASQQPEADQPAAEGPATATVDELLLADQPERWAELGFAVVDACCQLGAVRVRLAGRGAGRGIVGWSLRGIASEQLDGLPTTRSSSPLPSPAPEHPNGVLAIDHIVVMSPALDRSVLALQAAGLDLRRIREQPTPAGAPRQAFFRLGSEILEVVQQPEGAIEEGGGDDRPAHLWGLALLVSDLDRAVADLAPHVGSPRDAVQPGRRIATFRRSAGLATPIALMTHRPQGA
jgi:hypothetical protein